MVRAIAAAAVAAAVAGLAALAGLSCGGKSPAPPVVDDLEAEPRAPSIYDHVPADTPYFLAIATPSAEPTLEARLAALDTTLTLLRRLRADSPGERDGGGGDAERDAPLDFERVAAAGIDLDRPAVLYGLGLYPALQLAVSDLARLEPALDAALGSLGARRDDFGSRPRWTLAIGGARAVVIAGPERLGVALLPARLVAALSPAIAGDRRPRRALSDSGDHLKLARRYRIAERVGYVDVVGLARAVVGTEPFEVAGVEIAAAFDAAGGQGLSPGCRRELVALAGEVPRLVYGVRERGARRERVVLIAELAPSATARIARTRAAVPQIDSELAGRAELRVRLAVRPAPLLELVADALAVIGGAAGCRLEAEVAGPTDQLRALAGRLRGLAGSSLAVTGAAGGGDPLAALTGAGAIRVDDPDVFYAGLGGLGAVLRRGSTTRLPSPEPVFVHAGDRVFAASLGFVDPEMVDGFAAAAAVDLPELARLALRGELAQALQEREPDPELAAAAPEMAERLARLLTPVRFRSLELSLRLVERGLEAELAVDLMD
jgi:hypothetical protein